MIAPTLADGESFVEGRSGETAKALIEAAGERSAEVVTTSFGYVLPTELVPAGVNHVTNADTPAVITEPGTSVHEAEVYNVGGARTAPEDQEDTFADTPEFKAPGIVADTVTAQEPEGTEAKTEEDETGDAPAGSTEVEGVDGEADNGDNVDAFDPTTATVDQVKEYLEGADDAERARVIAVEQESDKPRKGVLDLAATTEEGK